MFPEDFEHEGEHCIAPMPFMTHYETAIARNRRNAPASPSEFYLMPEVWHRPPLTFDITHAKEILAASPRLPAFIDIDIFDGDWDTLSYLRLIYREREDEWPWIRTHVPGILGVHQGQSILLDGNHRYAKAKRLGQRYFLAFLLTDAEVAKIHVTDWRNYKFRGT